MDKKCSPLSVLLPHNRFRSPTKKDSRYVAYSWHIVSFPLNTNVCEYESQLCDNMFIASSAGL